MNKFGIIGIIIVASLLSYCVYNSTFYEKYKTLGNLGSLSIPDKNPIKIPSSKNPEHKYDGHRYRDNKRYNSNGQYR
jgi:hypothetical protein